MVSPELYREMYWKNADLKKKKLAENVELQNMIDKTQSRTEKQIADILENERMQQSINKELDDLANSVSGANIPEIAAIKDNTDKMADSIELSTEYLDLMKDVAEREAINKFTTVPLSIDARSTNNVSSNMDLDSMLVYIQGKLLEGINTAAEGVHF